MTQYRGAAVAIASDEKIALLGAIQSLFEGSMYTFVLLQTPALSPNGEDIPHGFIFATFLLSSMLGSFLASRLLSYTLTYIDIVHTLLKGLEKIVASADIPMLVCGDFNSVDLYGLLEGLDIAVKHLSKTSRQGLHEYKLAMFSLIWT
uniref:Endonuclease/exonuclease/phosphatase domain-containing protein n=1 Tax=Lactuca sativa TaxID=4236 RepID=A0A9R1VVI3_LACSA|nr:hypothetical protein LSAT_V11C400196560 [Lactuca sativa]